MHTSSQLLHARCGAVFLSGSFAPFSLACLLPSVGCVVGEENLESNELLTSVGMQACMDFCTTGLDGKLTPLF